MGHEIIIISALGIDERTSAALGHAFTTQSQGRYRLGSAEQAQLALVDLDAPNVGKLIDTVRSDHPRLPLIGLGQENPAHALSACLAKPIDISALIEAVDKFATPPARVDTGSSASSRVTADKIARAMNAIEARGIARSLNKRIEETQDKPVSRRAIQHNHDEMSFELERFLLGRLMDASTKAGTEEHIAVLTCRGDKVVIIDPARNRISTTLNDTQIRGLAIAAIDDDPTSANSVKCRHLAATDAEVQSLLALPDMRHFQKEVFLWDLGLMTCRGRIPTGISSAERVYLRRWPNLTRVHVPENAPRIIAYWLQQPCSLQDIHKQLGVPLADVFSVFSAAYAAGLTGESKRDADHLLGTAEIRPNKMRGLMGAILSRLHTYKNKQISRTA